MIVGFTFFYSRFSKRLTRLLFFSMVITANYGAILVSCYDSDLVSIYDYSGHSELLPNQFQPFSKICGNLPMVQPLLPISAEFSFFFCAYFHLINFSFRIFSTLFATKTTKLCNSLSHSNSLVPQYYLSSQSLISN